MQAWQIPRIHGLAELPCKGFSGIYMHWYNFIWSFNLIQGNQYNINRATEAKHEAQGKGGVE